MTSTVKADGTLASPTTSGICITDFFSDFSYQRHRSHYHSLADDAIATLQIQLPDNGFRTFHVHEGLLCQASPVFEAALQGQFGEAASRTITVKDALFTTLDDFVYWLYRGKCPMPSSTASPLKNDLLRHARLNSFAEKYDIAALKYDAAVSVVERVNNRYVFDSFWPRRCDLVNEIYSNTRPGDYFRTLLVALYVYRVHPTHFKSVDSAQYLERYPEFAIGIASAMGKRLAAPHNIKLDASMFTRPKTRPSPIRWTTPSAEIQSEDLQKGDE